MKVIFCKHCGKELSDKAQVCPDYGIPMFILFEKILNREGLTLDNAYVK